MTLATVASPDDEAPLFAAAAAVAAEAEAAVLGPTAAMPAAARVVAVFSCEGK